jgi:hypothetical protein
MGNRILAGFDGYMVMSADGYSDDISIGHARNVSIQTDVVTTDGYGYIHIQCSNNRENWVDVWFVDENGTVQQYKEVLKASFSHMFDISDIAAGWARVKYEKNDGYASGTGGLSYYVNLKK